jgi:hypothetical protein
LRIGDKVLGNRTNIRGVKTPDNRLTVHPKCRGACRGIWIVDRRVNTAAEKVAMRLGFAAEEVASDDRISANSIRGGGNRARKIQIGKGSGIIEKALRTTCRAPQVISNDLGAGDARELGRKNLAKGVINRRVGPVLKNESPLEVEITAGDGNEVANNRVAGDGSGKSLRARGIVQRGKCAGTIGEAVIDEI